MESSKVKYTVILGKNYVSKFLLQSSRDLSIDTFSEDETKINLDDKSIFSINKLKEKLLNNSYFYVNSDDCAAHILELSNNSDLKKSINTFKDKYESRKLLKSMYPKYYFEKININNIHKYKFPDKKIIIKPNKGFFGTGVRKIENERELKFKINESVDEVKENSKYFSDKILDKNNFIIEELIEGEEYAVDMYYDSSSKPVIINIYHHPYRDKSDTRNVLYYTNVEIMKRLIPKFEKIFSKIALKLKLQNFPLHAEFRETKNGMLIPIEVNPLRYGGFSLADLTHWAYDFNPYKYFFTNTKPDWDKIYKEKKNKHFGWILAYNANLSFESYIPDHNKFKNSFSKVLHYNKLDHKKYPVFATVYGETENLDEFYKYLSVDFGKFFMLK